MCIFRENKIQSIFGQHKRVHKVEILFIKKKVKALFCYVRPTANQVSWYISFARLQLWFGMCFKRRGKISMSTLMIVTPSSDDQSRINQTEETARD